jgi:hypothetical protein
MTVGIPHGSVVVTPTEMYHELRNVSDELKRLVAVVDPAIAEVRVDVAENKATIAAARAELWAEVRSLDRRLHGVQGRLWFAAGAAVALGGTGGWLASILTGGIT